MSVDLHTPPKRILIIKPSALGDVVTAMPVLRALRRQYPEAHISWLINRENVGLLDHDPDVNDIIEFDRKRAGRFWRNPFAAKHLLSLLRKLRKGRFDWVLDLQGLLRSGLFTGITSAHVKAGFANAREGATLFYNIRAATHKPHTVDRNIELARLLGVDARPDDFKLAICPKAKEYVQRLLQEHQLTRKEFLVCVPPTRWLTKQYPVSHWKQVLTSLRDKSSCVLVGAPSEHAMCEDIARGLGPAVINLAGKTRIAQMVALIEASAGVLCCDSAAALIAPAVGVDFVELVGPTCVERTGPYGGGTALVADIPCQGCLKRRCRHQSCMKLIKPSDVVSATAKILETGHRTCPTGS